MSDSARERAETLRALAIKLRERAAEYGLHDDEESIGVMLELYAEADAVVAALERVDALEADIERETEIAKAVEYENSILRGRVDALTEALQALVEMRDVHYEIYGYEKQHYIIDENAQWVRARNLLAALGDEPAKETQ